jgi:parallel beta-helix repeat protein
MALNTGTVLQNRYRIVSLMGQGGMGAVYRAWDLRLEMAVALKEMVPQSGLGPEALEGLQAQFHREAALVAKFDHPNLVNVSDFFEEGQNVYLVMSFVEGEDLQGYISRMGALPEARVLTWADQLLDALAYIHDRGILHRDIKPQNVILRPDGHVVLVDFGLVKLWNPNDPRTQTIIKSMGTPGYAPPEQYDPTRGHTDPRSDLYSLGATLYHTFTGQVPPSATERVVNPGSLGAVRRFNPNVSSRVESALMRALELRPAERFQNAREMRTALQQVSAPEPKAYAPPPSLPGATEVIPSPFEESAPPAPVPQKKSRAIWITLAIVVMGCLGLALLGGAGYWFFLRDGDGGSSATTEPAVTEEVEETEAVEAAPSRTITLPAEGGGEFANLADAVAALPPGSTINLEAATYRLDSPLEVSNALTLTGAGMTQSVIVSDAPEYVVHFTGDGAFVLRDLTVRHEGEAEADVVLAEGEEIVAQRCRFTGAVYVDGTPRAGLRVRGTTQGMVSSSEAVENDLDGFRLEEDAGLILSNNVCSDNDQIGIHLRDTSSAEINSNTCERNTLNGASIAGSATAVLNENTLRDNGESGLVYFGDSGGAAYANTVTGNGLHGISVNDNAAPTVENNTCTGNDEDGLAYFEASGGTARGNDCSHNGLHGIGVSGSAAPVLENNLCTDNNQVGIRFSDDSSGTARDNACNRNGLSGIIVRDQAAPTLENNTVRDNLESGLAYFGSAGGVARSHTCTGNGLHGIDLYGTSNPLIEDNDVSGNTQGGIRFSDDVTARVVGNTCISNTLSGIIVRDQAQPTLESNVVQQNEESGISFFNNSGGAAQGNTITNNGLNGFSVNDSATPTLRNNDIADNAEAGIAYFETAAGIAQNNTLSRNQWGIYVEETANPALGENTFVNNETDLDDRRPAGQRPTPPPEATSEASVLFADDFSDPDPRWWTGEDDEGEVWFADGKLHITNYTKADYGNWTKLDMSFTDVVIEAESTHVGGTLDDWHKLECRLDGDQYYYGGYSSDGYVGAGREYQNELTALVEPFQSDVVKQGTGVTNSMRLSCVGTQIRFWVNDVLVAEFTDDALTQGNVGFAVNALDGEYVEITFDNLRVLAP